MPTNEELQTEIEGLRSELNTLRDLFFKDNYSNLQVFRKKVQFNSDAIFGSSLGLSLNKLGFYTIASAPIIQPTTGIAGATFVAGAGTAVNDASTFDGYTLKQVVKALRNLGLLT